MRTALLIVLLSVIYKPCLSQDSTAQKQGNYFIVLYTTGDNWDNSKQPSEQTNFKEHSAHLSQLRKEKRIEIGGRYSDTGMLLLKANDQAEAEALITKDIAIQQKLFKVSIFPFSPFYKGCIE